MSTFSIVGFGAIFVTHRDEVRRNAVDDRNFAGASRRFTRSRGGGPDFEENRNVSARDQFQSWT